MTLCLGVMVVWLVLIQVPSLGHIVGKTTTGFVF